MKTSEILVKAKSILLNPDAWYKKGGYAADKDGYETEVLSEEAYQFCAIGAVFRSVDKEPDYAYKNRAPEVFNAEIFLDTACNLVSEEANFDMVTFNDHPSTTHEMILQAYDRAIELAKMEETPE